MEGHTSDLLLQDIPCRAPGVMYEPSFPPSAVKDLDPALQLGISNPQSDVDLKAHLAQVGGRINWALQFAALIL